MALFLRAWKCKTKSQIISNRLLASVHIHVRLQVSICSLLLPMDYLWNVCMQATVAYSVAYGRVPSYSRYSTARGVSMVLQSNVFIATGHTTQRTTLCIHVGVIWTTVCVIQTTGEEVCVLRLNLAQCTVVSTDIDAGIVWLYHYTGQEEQLIISRGVISNSRFPVQYLTKVIILPHKLQCILAHIRMFIIEQHT